MFLAAVLLACLPGAASAEELDSNARLAAVRAGDLHSLGTETSRSLAPAANPEIVGVYLSHGYWQPDEIEDLMAELEALGVNMVIDYALTPPEDHSWQAGFGAYLDSAERHGIGVVFYLGSLLNGLTPGNGTDRFNDVISTVAELKRYPQIMGWYVHDEVLPMVSEEQATVQYTISLEQMQSLYRAIRTEDPRRPQLNVWSQLPTYQQFVDMFPAEHTPYGRPAWMNDPTEFEAAMRRMVRETCDWVLVDSYPIGAQWPDHGSLPELEYVAAITGRADGLRAPHQPLYLVFQSFSWAQYGRARWVDAPFPTFAQMREMLCVGWLNGARGAIAYSWFDLTRDIPGRDIPGRQRCLDDLRRVLTMLAQRGWPADRSRLPYETASSW